jgi:DNA-binding FadR family transcriptional regulator
MTEKTTEMTFEPLTKDRLYRGIVDQITEAILTGKMRPGDRLPTENELADHFGVSRTVVREATQALRAQGLVEVTPGRGTFISQPSIESVINSLQLMLTLEDHSFDDLIATRLLLEVPIARLAAENARPENIEVLRTCNEGMKTSLHKPDSYMEYDMQFHAELARATQNTVLSVLVQPLIMMLQSARRILSSVPGKAQRSLDCHHQIYEAIVRHDGEAAAQGMRDHLDQIARDRDRARTSSGDGDKARS